MRKTEIPHNTPDQVREYVASAAGVADEYRDRGETVWASVFTAAYAGFSGKQIMLEQPQPLDLSPLRSRMGGH